MKPVESSSACWISPGESEKSENEPSPSSHRHAGPTCAIVLAKLPLVERRDADHRGSRLRNRGSPGSLAVLEFSGRQSLRSARPTAPSGTNGTRRHQRTLWSPFRRERPGGSRNVSEPTMLRDVHEVSIIGKTPMPMPSCPRLGASRTCGSLTWPGARSRMRDWRSSPV